MRYLISGHPRTRTAWLCALLNAHRSLCYHDVITYPVDTSLDVGFCDPGFACLIPREALQLAEGKPRICLVREDWPEALEEWCGTGVPDELVEQWNENCEIFERGVTGNALPFTQLEDDCVVKEVIELCTQQPASMTLIEIFQGLKIEQHLAKAQFAWNRSRSMSMG